MTDHTNTGAVLDQKINDGFNRFRETYSGLSFGPRTAYIQGFLDGIRSNLDELAKAYKLDAQPSSHQSHK